MDIMPSPARPFVTITEQPAAKQQRFRYLSEVDGARSVGSIPGVNSLPERKTYPTIRVHGHQGPFLVLVSLLNPDNDLVHPHSITGSDPRYKRMHGVIYVIADKPEVVFKNIGILCVKGKTEKDVKTALKIRKQKNIDPFGAGFAHIDDHRLIDFTAVRLCFQVFLPGRDWTPADLHDPLKYTTRLRPVASDVVYDAKKLNDLKIVYINSCAGSVLGGHEMTLLCDKYTGQNPDVVFEDDRGWSARATVTMYHKQLAIVFVAPSYQDPSCNDLKVNVYLQQSNERGVQRSQPAVVEYLPHDPKGGVVKFPTPYPVGKSGMTLKQVRIQQRPGLDRSSPEDRRLKRWRPWGRGGGAPPPEPSLTDSEEDRSTLSQNDDLDVVPMAPNDADKRPDTIPLFDPATSPLYTNEWISKIDQLGAVNGWSDTVKSYYMQTRLSGIAKLWLSSLRNIDNMTWPEWKQMLLEAFPRNRKVDYVELLKEMLSQRKSTSETAQYIYNKEDGLLTRHEMNAKKAFACLIEGLPLQMTTNEHYETHDLDGPKYHIDLRDPLNPPQIHPINLNINDYKLGTIVQDNDKIVKLNSYKIGTSIEENEKAMKEMEDFMLDRYGQEDSARGCCCCKEEPRRRYVPNRLNEIRPSCIQRHPSRAVIEPSWHQPCSTLTSSSSSPSVANPAPDWLTDQSSPVPGNHSITVDDITKEEEALTSVPNDFTAPSYPGNKLNKQPSRKACKLQPRTKTKATDFDAAPGKPRQQVQTFSPYPVLEPSPNYQLLSSPVNNPFEVLDSNNAVQGNNSILPQYDQNNGNPFAANVDLNFIRTPFNILGGNNVLPDSSENNNSMQSTVRVPASTGVKRTVLERNCAKGDSGELPSLKRDRLMSHNFQDPEPQPSTSYASNNPFNVTNVPLPHVCNLPAPEEYFPIREENIANMDNSVLLNEARGSNPSKNDPTKPTLCSDEVLDAYLNLLDDEQIKEMLSMVKKEEEWYSQVVNPGNVNLDNANNVLSNPPINIGQNVPPNDNYNVLGFLGVDQICYEVSVSEEMRRMNFED